MPNVFENLVSHGSSFSSAQPPRRRLGDILVAQGHVSAEQLENVLELQDRLSARIGRLLVSDCQIGPDDISAALAVQQGTSLLDLAQDAPDPDLFPRLGLDFCLEYRMVPWRRVGACTILAAVDPDKFHEMRDELTEKFGPVRLGIVSEADFDRAITQIASCELAHRAETRTCEDHSCRYLQNSSLVRSGGSALVCLAALLLVYPGIIYQALALVALGLLLMSTMLKSAAVRVGPSSGNGLSALEEAEENIVPLPNGPTQKLPTVSILVPLYREESVALNLVERLNRLDYPASLLDICLVTEADDHVTAATLQHVSLPRTMRVLTAPPSQLRTKPRALNFALDFCHGDIIGIYDAEDAPAPDQITRVVDHFRNARPDVACIQGRLGFYNVRSSWISRCFAIDYAGWFSVLLPGIEKLGLLVPLGGTTLFFRRDALIDLGGWDAHNVTEDADLGVRLGRSGYRTEMLDSTTLEEATCRPIPWIRQRSRWIKGYAMTYAAHMREPRQYLAQVGPRRFFGFQIMFLGSFVQSLLAPVLWCWWLIPFGLEAPFPSWGMPLTMAILITAEVANLAVGILGLKRTGQLRLLPFVPLLHFYNMLATFAAYKALFELIIRPFYWDKTGHGLPVRRTLPI